MLTREQAKKQPCPYFVNTRSEDGIIDCIFCRAEECPKWHDCTDETFYCNAELFSCAEQSRQKCRTTKKIDDCRNCPERFGYCG